MARQVASAERWRRAGQSRRLQWCTSGVGDSARRKRRRGPADLKLAGELKDPGPASGRCSAQGFAAVPSSRGLDRGSLGACECSKPAQAGQLTQGMQVRSTGQLRKAEDAARPAGRRRACRKAAATCAIDAQAAGARHSGCGDHDPFERLRRRSVRSATGPQQTGPAAA